MLHEDGSIYVIEFNSRFGDPEAEAILAANPKGIFPVLRLIAEGGWVPASRKFGSASQAAVATVLAAPGYPDAPQLGAKITIPAGLESEDLLLFHAGTSRDADGTLRVAGGRVLVVTGLGPTVEAAAKRSRAAAEAIAFEGKQYRKDIGWRDIARSSS